MLPATHRLRIWNIRLILQKKDENTMEKTNNFLNNQRYIASKKIMKKIIYLNILYKYEILIGGVFIIITIFLLVNILWNFIVFVLIFEVLLMLFPFIFSKIWFIFNNIAIKFIKVDKCYLYIKKPRKDFFKFIFIQEYLRKEYMKTFEITKK